MSGKSKVWGAVMIGVGIYMAGRTIGNIVRLYRASDRVKSAQTELSDLKKEKEKLEAKLTEVKTTDFVERTAREKLGLGKPGEVVVVMDDSVSSVQYAVSKNDEPNWQKWRKLYLGF